ncbi:MAG: S-methyl-5-thioribose kinase [Chloroflexota bacterium]
MNQVHLLTPAQALAYIQSHCEYFPAGAQLEASEIASDLHSVEGYVNNILRIRDSHTGRSLIYKQMSLGVKGIELTDPGQALSLDRLKVEVGAFKLWDAICPGCVPQVYAWDEARSILLMEDLAQMKLARFELARRKQFPHFASQVGEFLGRSAFYTSDLYLEPLEKKALVQAFANPRQRVLLERLIFDRLLLRPPDDPLNPYFEADLQAFLVEPPVVLELLKLKEIYLQRAQSLIHNDFHTANIFLSQDTMKVIDAEMAFVGPTGYDLGQLIGSLMLSCLSLQVLDDVSLVEKIEYETYLLRTLEQIAHQFERSFAAAYVEHARPEYRACPGYLDDTLRRILQDAAGYAGMLAVSRLYDLGMSYDFARIPDLRRRAAGQRLVLRSARRLLLEREQFTKIEDISAALKQIKSEFKIAALVTQQLTSRHITQGDE